MSHGHSEDSDDGIADELLNDAAMTFNRGARRRAIAAQQRVDILGICVLSKRGEADDVAEERRDHLAFLAKRLRGRQWGAAVRAEPRVVRSRSTARGTEGHVTTTDADVAYYGLQYSRGTAR